MCACTLQNTDDLDDRQIAGDSTQPRRYTVLVLSTRTMLGDTVNVMVIINRCQLCSIGDTATAYRKIPCVLCDFAVPVCEYGHYVLFMYSHRHFVVACV